MTSSDDFGREELFDFLTSVDRRIENAAVYGLEPSRGV